MTKILVIIAGIVLIGYGGLHVYDGLSAFYNPKPYMYAYKIGPEGESWMTSNLDRFVYGNILIGLVLALSGGCLPFIIIKKLRTRSIDSHS